MEKITTFISYSHKDLDVVTRIVKKLEMEGLSCWYAARDIPPGSDFPEVITSTIKSAHAFLIIASENADKSKHVKNEINIAMEWSVTIYPVQIQKFDIKNFMPYYTGRTHWVDAINPPIEDHLERLAAQIKAAEIKCLPNESKDANCSDKPDKKKHIPPVSTIHWRRWFLPLCLALTAILVLGGLVLMKHARRPQYAAVQVSDRSIDFRMEDSGALVLLPSGERNGHLTLTLPEGRYVLEILADANEKGGIRLENVKSGTKLAMEGAEPHPESDEFSILCSGSYPLSPELDDQIRIVFFKLHSAPVRLGWTQQPK